MPPVLDPSKSKVDGLAFVGLSFARKDEEKGHPDSQTHQTAFDLHEVLDRDYEHIFSTNDDGWLVGGGEPGPPKSYKLAAPDSAHVEILRIGTFNPECGGVSQQDILDAFRSCKILVPEIRVVPTAVVANGDLPPELEIRFDMEPAYHDPEPDSGYPALPVNWQLRFLHNQLFEQFQFPSRFCPGAFHSTILRKAEFRSDAARTAYFAKCARVVDKWRQAGPQPLIPKHTAETIERIVPKDETNTDHPTDTEKSGIWLFTDRENISHFIAPNFLPPYDTPEKRKIIHDVLSQEWDQDQLCWKPASPLPKPLLVMENNKRGKLATTTNPLACGAENFLCMFGMKRNGNKGNNNCSD